VIELLNCARRESRLVLVLERERDSSAHETIEPLLIQSKSLAHFLVLADNIDDGGYSVHSIFREPGLFM